MFKANADRKESWWVYDSGWHYPPFDQDADGVSHELVGHLQNLMGKCGTDEAHLGGGGQVTIHVVDLFFET